MPWPKKWTTDVTRPLAATPPDDLKTWNERLKWCRARFEQSCNETAKQLGMSQSYLQHLENDERPVGLTTLMRLAKYYGVSVDWLWLGEPYRELKNVKDRSSEPQQADRRSTPEVDR